MKRKTAIAVGAGALAVLLAGAYVASPFLALRELKAAAHRGDRDRLAQLVDFPAVRQNMKSQLSSQLMSRMRPKPERKRNPFAALGALVAPALVDRVVDSAVTPDALATLMTQGRAGGAESAESGQSKADKSSSGLKRGFAYEGLDRFDVYFQPADSPDARVTLTLQRMGLFAWRVTRVDMSGLLSKRVGAPPS